MHCRSVVGIDDHHEPAVLVGADRRIGNQQRAISSAAGDANAREHAGLKKSVGVWVDAAPSHRPGVRIDSVIYEIDHAFVRKSRFARDGHEGWDLGVAR